MVPLPTASVSRSDAEFPAHEAHGIAMWPRIPLPKRSARPPDSRRTAVCRAPVLEGALREGRLAVGLSELLGWFSEQWEIQEAQLQPTWIA